MIETGVDCGWVWVGLTSSIEIYVKSPEMYLCRLWFWCYWKYFNWDSLHKGERHIEELIRKNPKVKGAY